MKDDLSTELTNMKRCPDCERRFYGRSEEDVLVKVLDHMKYYHSEEIEDEQNFDARD